MLIPVESTSLVGGADPTLEFQPCALNFGEGVLILIKHQILETGHIRMVFEAIGIERSVFGST